MNTARSLTILLLVSLVIASPATARPHVLSAPEDQEFEQLKAEAERLYAEGSYGQALALYRQAEAMDLDDAEQRWVQFRLGDTMWRNEAATQTHDDTTFDRAREKLTGVVDQYTTASDRDEIWAATQRSLGDFWWSRRQVQNWGQAWPHYRQALDYWAGQRDLETARRRYLGIVFDAAEPAWVHQNYWSRQYVHVPADVLENAVEIAQTGEDLSHAQYLLAIAMRGHGGWRHQQRVESLFQAVIDGKPSNEWYDDALFYYAEWLSQQGRIVRGEAGGWTSKPDYETAIDLYQRLMREFRKGETQYWDTARQRVTEITSPSLHLAVSNVFLPGSEIRFDLNWRNVEAIELAIHRIDLTRDVTWPASAENHKQWLDAVDLGGAETVRSWTKQTGDTGEHLPSHESVNLEEALPPGAYILVAAAGGVVTRDLLLITDATIVMKSVSGHSLVYVCDALDGSPIPGADVTLWEVRQSSKGRRWISARHQEQTGDDGSALIHLTSGSNWTSLFVAARKDDHQSFNVASAPGRSPLAHQYRIYAWTDRPAYRPGDEVQWKINARLYDDSRYTTPADQAVHYEIHDPRGTKAKEGDLTLNAFGAAWDDLEVTDAMPLGEYTVRFWTEGRTQHIGNATLFRLEEYKLPEFEVTIETPRDENDRRKVFQLGDMVEVEVQADYYFGAPVANADVEIVVHQRPFWHWWQPPKQYGWLYDDSNPYRWNDWGGQGTQIRREQLRTDETGRATLSFETPLNADQDFEYTIEARVIDPSRREVTASDTVRVTRQKYFAYASSPHNIYEPGDEVTIDFKALDANQQPVATQGHVEIFRDEWKEIWVAPDGREVTGRELAEERQRHRVFPPRPDPGRIGWRLKHRGYTSDLIDRVTITTNDEGEAQLEFTAEKVGYYRITWTSEKNDLWPIHAQTTVWVCDDASRVIGYHQGGVDIIVDKDTFRAGETAPAMISVPTNDRYVLFTIEGNDLHSHRLVHVQGTVKLIQIEVTEQHEPNVWLTASMISEGQLFSDVEQVVVPPVDHFLDVDVSLSADTFEPGATGALTVVTKDHDGRPVSAELGVALVDESIFYIQQELAGDPRAFFFNDRQRQQVQTSATLYQKQYVKLLKNDRDEIVPAPLRADRGEMIESAEEFAHLQEGAVMRNEKAGATRGMASAGPGAAMEDEVGNSFAGGGGRFGRATSSAPVPADAQLSPRERLGRELAGGAEADQPVRVRSDFRATALWIPDLVTGDDGVATAEIHFPDSTTRWKASARAATTGSQFGIGHATAKTRQPLIVRLQAPRFFVAGDHALVSAVLNNNTDDMMTAHVDLEIDGLDVSGTEIEGRPVDAGALEHLDIPAQGSTRIDWRVLARAPGDVRVVITARAGPHSDGMQKTYIVHEHGIEKHLVKSGKVRGDDVTVTIDIPSERDPQTTALSVQITPSMAVTMVDALPYLIDYPYGCTEQTMSRFLPATIVAKTLQDLGIDPEVAMARALGRDLPADGAGRGVPAADDAKSLDELNDMIAAGLARLADFQHSDGGWGWWKHSESDHYMTAYVVWGLSLAKQAGVALDEEMLAQGARYLREELVEEEFNYDFQSWMLHALASYHQAIGEDGAAESERKAVENLWKNRDRLNAFTRALFALAVHAYGDEEKAAVLARNLVNGVRLDESPDTSVVMRGEQESHAAVIATAHWGEDGIYHRWSDGGIEATAFALKALLAIDPDHALIEPVMNWLVKNRRGAQWSNTRDTAIVVLALNDYLRTSGEASPDLEFELLVNGESITSRKVTGDEVFAAPSTFDIDPELIRDGRNEVRILRRGGDGTIYFTAHARFFSREEPVEAAGNEIFVRRDYYKLVPYRTLLKGYEFDRVPMGDGDSVRSGERVEVVVTIEAKNNYEYLVFEDLKPAGLEAVQVQSGTPIYAKQLKRAGIERRFESDDPVDASQIARDSADYTGQNQAVFQELRDRHVAMFIDHLPEGVWELQYELRAEVPGEFHALPVLGHAMYVPEIRCNSREVRMTVYDRE